jgi:hypothetical protein
LLRLSLRLLLWAALLTLVLVWLIAAGVVWIIEAVVAWRRKTAMPSFTVPRATSDPKFGRTAGTAVAVVVLLMLVASGNSGTTPEPVQASSGTASSTRLSLAPGGAPSTETPATANRAARNDAAARRAAKARAARRAKARAERRAAEARAARRRQKARERAAAEAARRQTATGSSSKCDPNYKGACLDPSASDYDCEGGSGDGPKYTGPVQVVGSDPFDLDRDRDGVGCDS